MASLLFSLPGVSLLRQPFRGAPIAGVIEHVEATFGDAIEARLLLRCGSCVPCAAALRCVRFAACGIHARARAAARESRR
jgi:hypothetical protein